MTTLMLLLARHDGQEEISFRQMAKEYFGLKPEALARKIKNGKVTIRFSTDGMKSARTSKVPLTQLARYIEERRAAAITKMNEYGTE
jgi:hypothetical protein